MAMQAGNKGGIAHFVRTKPKFVSFAYKTLCKTITKVITTTNQNKALGKRESGQVGIGSFVSSD